MSDIAATVEAFYNTLDNMDAPANVKAEVEAFFLSAVTINSQFEELLDTLSLMSLIESPIEALNPDVEAVEAAINLLEAAQVAFQMATTAGLSSLVGE
jgi:hypothetical protein